MHQKVKPNLKNAEINNFLDTNKLHCNIVLIALKLISLTGVSVLNTLLNENNNSNSDHLKLRDVVPGMKKLVLRTFQDENILEEIRGHVGNKK